MNQKTLHGLKIIVTGGSRGLGEAIVRLLASEGAQVAFSYSSRQDLAEKILSELSGEGHFTFPLNLADPASILKEFGLILEKWPEVDGLVNNAGITRDNLLLRMKDEDFDTVINTNLKGAFLTTRFMCKPFMKARRGSIVNITSVVGQTGNAGQANYAASKAGLIAFTKSVAQEMGSRNIRVNCIAPGFIETEMTANLPEEVKMKTLGRIPLGHFGVADDIAQGVRFLLSSEAKYITGQTLSINGGLYMGGS